VHASPAELPELNACLGTFQVRFRRPAGVVALERSMTGLLTEWPNQHGDPSAQAVPSPREQRRQAFLTNRPWDEADLHRQRVQTMRAEASVGHGVVGWDDPGVAKPGQASVGGPARTRGPWARWATVSSR
jgi:hypothetical protein